MPGGPLAAEVRVFDRSLTRILLVCHRRRGWVPPGGRVEPGETPREAARRELLEETGVRARLRYAPVAVTVRSFHPDLSATWGFAYVAVVDRLTRLVPEAGQPAAWRSLSKPWEGWFSGPRADGAVRRPAARCSSRPATACDVRPYDVRGVRLTPRPVPPPEGCP
ncbi:hypothetical protein GCM10027072_06000 [Streptomyces bullii]